MIVSIGTRVRIRHTGEEGIVRRFLEGDMLEVYLPNDDFSIPVSVEDLEKPGSKKAEPPVIPDEPEDRVPLPEDQFQLLTRKGFLLAFEPDEEDARFGVFLVNHTNTDILYSFQRLSNGSPALSGHGKLAAREWGKVDEILKAHIGAHTAYLLECWPIKKTGTGLKHQKEIRLRPKGFFKNLSTVPVLNRKMYTYSVFSGWQKKKEASRTEDLKSYTQKHLRPSSQKRAEEYFRHYEQHNVQEFAEFIPEIDLHIQALRPDAAGLPKKDILRLQLDAFEEFLAKAIRLGVERVFVIHGIGKGKLRDAIFTRLMNNPDINTFRNEYHPRYGWGATEIILV